jgi:hypothetical protein
VRGQPWPGGSRLHDTAGFAPPTDDERLYKVVEAMDEVAAETGKTLLPVLERAVRRAQPGRGGRRSGLTKRRRPLAWLLVMMAVRQLPCVLAAAVARGRIIQRDHAFQRR